MLIAPIPADEPQRLNALCELNILDTVSEERFDRLTRITQRHFQVPIVLISLVDEARQWFKSRQGLAATETSREVSFCGHAIFSNDIFYVPDAHQDERFFDNPLVTGPPYVRFYAGAPLCSVTGLRLGTLCIIDNNPRQLSESDFTMLRDLANCIEYELRQVPMRQAAQIIQEQKAHLEAVLDSALDAILSLDEDGIIETANPATQMTFGYSDGELIGRHFKLLLAEQGDNCSAFLKECCKRAESKDFKNSQEVNGCRKDGTSFPMEISISGMKQGRQRFFVVVVRDISERKRMEMLKSQFVSTVSHELRTPLTSIRGSLGLIGGGAAGELPAKAKQLLDIASKNSERLVRLINDILDIEKIEAGKMVFDFQTLCLRNLLEHSRLANQGYAEQYQVKLHIATEVSSALVSGDHDRLEQVLSNLISNACKYSPPNGIVTLGLRYEAPWFRISISDQGPGIPDSFRTRIFQKFAQADSSDTRQKGGTGLGLSICKAIAERHRGQIGFDSEAGKGSTFFILIPAQDNT